MPCFFSFLFLFLYLTSIDMNFYAAVFHAQGKVNDVYDTCSSVLVELGESIPDSSTLSTSEMIRETLKMYNEIGCKWLEAEKTDDKTLNTTLQLYRAIALASFFCKHRNMVVYFTCKAVQLTLQRGLCEFTLVSIMQFASVTTLDDNAALC